MININTTINKKINKRYRKNKLLIVYTILRNDLPGTMGGGREYVVSHRSKKVEFSIQIVNN